MQAGSRACAVAATHCARTIQRCLGAVRRSGGLFTAMMCSSSYSTCTCDHKLVGNSRSWGQEKHRQTKDCTAAMSLE